MHFSKEQREFLNTKPYILEAKKGNQPSIFLLWPYLKYDEKKKEYSKKVWALSNYKRDFASEFNTLKEVKQEFKIIGRLSK